MLSLILIFAARLLWDMCFILVMFLLFMGQCRAIACAERGIFPKFWKWQFWALDFWDRIRKNEHPLD